MTRYLAALLLCACGTYDLEQAPAPDLSTDVVALPAELADVGELAALLWADAGYGMPRPTAEADDAAVRVSMVTGPILNCGDSPEGETYWGCTDREAFHGHPIAVWISDTVPLKKRVSTLAHEFGHVLGYGHTHDGTLMDPDRGADARVNPCVDDVCLADVVR